MKFLTQLLVLLTVAPAAVFSSPLERRQSSRQSEVNVFQGTFQYVQQDYANNLRQKTAASFRQEGDETNARKTEKVAETASTFIWYTALTSKNYWEPMIRDAANIAQQRGQKVTVPFIIYNMPDRDCGSEASVGELQFNNGGFSKYQGMINDIVNVIDRYPQLNYAIILEPDSIANMATNIGVNRCQQGLYDQYISVYAHAIQRLQKPNVGIYIDVGHGQWTGWPDNVKKVGNILQQIMDKAGSANKIRGYATNVSNYQPYNNPNPTTTNPNYDEKHFGEALAAEMTSRGLPAKFIHDTGRAGRPEALIDGVWCNLKGAGLGPRPSAETGNELVDAFVWAKPPGDSDGSSIQGGPGYDTSCTGPNNLQPAPQPGGWFTEYSKMLIRNANPPIEL